MFYKRKNPAIMQVVAFCKCLKKKKQIERSGNTGLESFRDRSDLEERYDGILETAEKEYEYEPPSDYYREGYNLYRRLKKYKDSELLFLHDKRVPANNSLCEHLARIYKRIQKQAMVLWL